MRFCLVAVLAVAASTAAHGGASEIDRTSFFQKCATLVEWRMDPVTNQAVIDGKSRLTSARIAAINHLLDTWEKHGDGNRPRLAYILATARRESEGTFLPLREVPGCGTNDTCREGAIGRMLEKRAKARNVPVRANYAVVDASTGQRYYGRGYIQLTSRENYATAGKRLGSDFVSEPDKVLQPSVAGEILVKGMLKGWFGDKQPLSYYLDEDRADWINARNNVNPKSPNKPVTAEYGKQFLACLQTQ